MPAMTLAQYLHSLGPGGGARFASQIGVHQTTLSKWRRGHAMPRMAQMARIEELTEGAVTVGEMMRQRLANMPRRAVS